MLLHDPIIITSRLLPGVRVGDATISIAYSDRAGDRGRDRYRWHIDLPDAEFTGDDLQSGCCGGSLQSGLASLLTFLGAFAEAQRYPGSENADLFQAELADWAVANDDELSMLAMELAENPDLIQD